MTKLNRLAGLLAVVAAVCLISVVPRTASSFCGTYVGGGKADLFNNATQVVMMRDGQNTVLSMQNNYQGPTKDFAMVVPTPEVLHKRNVKVLKDEVFERIDRLTAPRLVEYWEKDPCQAHYGGGSDTSATYYDAGAPDDNTVKDGGTGPVRIKAKFAAGEYEILVLSSTKSTALETWLRDNGYNIPKGAAPYLKPYITAGNYFFVAKVDSEKVEFDKNGNAVLSPLRFHYQSKEFKLPVRLGLINSNGSQDLIINILAQGQRYEVANYENVSIPTNLRVADGVKDYFPSFYRALFQETLEQNRDKQGNNPVVTEYAWDASKCDPCPGPSLDPRDYVTFGARALFSGRVPFGGWTVTRLHARYDKHSLGKDLVFTKASSIRGGRGEPDNLTKGARASSRNRFQGRYVIAHEWEGPINCSNPRRGRWSGSPNVQSSPGQTNRRSQPKKDVDLEKAVVDNSTGGSNTGGGGKSGNQSGGEDTTTDGAGGPSDAGADAAEASNGQAGGSDSGCSAPAGDVPMSPFSLFAILVALGVLRRKWAGVETPSV